MITQDRLKELLHYDPDTGIWTWVKPNAKRVKVGDKAGTLQKNGYLYIKIDNKAYRSCRLVFLYMTGSLPTNIVDHKNRVKNDDRWENLCESSPSENQQNRGEGRNNKSGYMGVHWHQAQQKWHSYITDNRKRIHLGSFDNKQDAIAARQAAELKYHRTIFHHPV